MSAQTEIKRITVELEEYRHQQGNLDRQNIDIT